MRLSAKFESFINKYDCKINKESANLLSKFIKQGSSFKVGTIFYIQQHHMMNIYEIEAIMLNDSDEILLACYSYKSVQFDEHLQSFQLDRINDLYLVFNAVKYETKPINLHVVNGKTYLRRCNYVDCNTVIPNTVIKLN